MNAHEVELYDRDYGGRQAADMAIIRKKLEEELEAPKDTVVPNSLHGDSIPNELVQQQGQNAGVVSRNFLQRRIYIILDKYRDLLHIALFQRYYERNIKDRQVDGRIHQI
jgi:hypothetical protein